MKFSKRSEPIVTIELDLNECYILYDYIHNHGYNYEVDLPKMIHNKLKEVLDEN